MQWAEDQARNTSGHYFFFQILNDFGTHPRNVARQSSETPLRNFRMNEEDLGVKQLFQDWFIACPVCYALAGATLLKSWSAFQIIRERVLFLKTNFYVPPTRKLCVDLFIAEIPNYHCHHFSFWSL